MAEGRGKGRGGDRVGSSHNPNLPLSRPLALAWSKSSAIAGDKPSTFFNWWKKEQNVESRYLVRAG